MNDKINTEDLIKYCKNFDIEGVTKLLDKNKLLDLKDNNYPNLFYLDLPQSLIENNVDNIINIINKINEYYLITGQRYKYVKKDNLNHIEYLTVNYNLSNEIKERLTANQAFGDDFVYRLTRLYIFDEKYRNNKCYNILLEKLENGEFMNHSLFVSLVIETFNSVKKEQKLDAQDVLLKLCKHYQLHYKGLEKQIKNIYNYQNILYIVSKNVYNTDYIDFVMDIYQCDEKSIPPLNIYSIKNFEKNNTTNVFLYMKNIIENKDFVKNIHEKNKMLRLSKDMVFENEKIKQTNEKKKFKL